MENKKVALRLFEELDNKNPSIFKELCVDDARIYMPGRSEPYTVSEIIELVSTFYDGLPDYAHTIEDVISEGEKVVVRCTDRATHTGELMGISPTGNKVEYGEIVIFRFADGKITEAWVQEDDLWMMQQLGMDLVPKESGS
jgi:predicted ester cyclase